MPDRSPTIEEEAAALEEWLIEGGDGSQAAKADSVAILRLTLARLEEPAATEVAAYHLLPGDVVLNIGTVATVTPILLGGVVEVRYTSRPGTPYPYAAGRRFAIRRPA
jgi:hypothetical protein